MGSTGRWEEEINRVSGLISEGIGKIVVYIYIYIYIYTTACCLDRATIYSEMNMNSKQELIELASFGEVTTTNDPPSPSEDEAPIHADSPLVDHSKSVRVIDKRKAPYGILLLEYLGVFKFHARKW